ncbi:uncharacterized protein LOC133911534 isoform X1 [Phragmites australis]|uniref:uncharacterized protein LOC133911534 isoform X1 n=1 Tax=Phragmites australis TaxID=29695 RepID=UPI002D766C8E|nr:uncharacterized protein LOC133911534 isoform X1 [Phragmites australis]
MAATGQEEDDIDHYEVLCLPSGEEGAALTIEQIEKSYRTQSRLRHPDKRPDDPNATADFQRLSSSYKLLRDESLRRQFDARLRARREAASRAAAAGVKRRKAVSDLEERERAAATGQPTDPGEVARREAKRKAADIQRELDEFRAAKQAAASGAASTSGHGDKKGGAPQDGVKTDKGKILKVSWDGSADSYTAAKLEELFQKFGKVEDIVIKTSKSRSRGSAIVVMGTKEAANRVDYQQGQLKHMNRGQATSMELDLVIWKHRYSGNFKRPRKGNRVANCFFLKHVLVLMYDISCHLRIPGVIDIPKSEHVCLVRSFVADNFL